jgi:adenylate cyclase
MIEEPDPAAITAQLHQILISPAFKGTPQLQEFLRFVVQETLEGRSSGIKEYTIGTHVYKRPPSYDPRTDAAVRVGAVKLRSRLALYYESAPADSLLIDLPKGGYVPQFSWRRALRGLPPGDSDGDGYGLEPHWQPCLASLC